MLIYNWVLDYDTSWAKNPPLSQAQRALAKHHIVINLTMSNDKPVLQICIPESAVSQEEKPAIVEEIQPVKEAESVQISAPEPVSFSPEELLQVLNITGTLPRRGRPFVAPEQDISIAEFKALRDSGLTMDAIAELAGISKRTLFRRWKIAQEKGLESDTKLSDWK